MNLFVDHNRYEVGERKTYQMGIAVVIFNVALIRSKAKNDLIMFLGEWPIEMII